MFWMLSAAAATLTVGPSGAYATPCAAIAAANAGDTVEVDASGAYAGDTCAWSTDRLTIRGVNGRPRLDGSGANLAEQKGIFVIHAEHARIENLEFVGAKVADQNGAGIRHQGTDLVVHDCRFEGNENGILGSPATDGTGSVIVTDSEFVHNGAGDGYSHNLYLGHYAKVSFRGSYSHDGNVGHLFKSRAAYTEIVASRLSDESGGGASYEVDLPNGGEAWIVGSVIEQSSTTENSTILAFAEEGLGANTVAALHVVGSTFRNDHDRGTFVNAAEGAAVSVVDTVFSGPGTLVSTADAKLTSTWDDRLGDPGFADAATLDFSLSADSPLRDAGSAPPDGVLLDAEYVWPTGETPRGVAGSAVDIGAFEYGNPGAGDSGDPGGDPADSDQTGAADSAAACGCAHGSPAPALSVVAATLFWRRGAPRGSGRSRPPS